VKGLVLKNLFKNSYFLILVGILALYLAFTRSPESVSCKGVEMKPGDMCGDLTYEAKQRSNNIFTYGLIGVGAVLIIVSVRNIRKKGKK
jgi:hypothetical protein